MQFFYRDQFCGRTVYHSHRSCQLVPHDPSSLPEWVTLEVAPEDRVLCSICSELDRSSQIDVARRDLAPILQALS